MKICSNCVMDETDSKISFGNDGICDHCKIFYKKILPSWNHGKNKEQELKSIIQGIKSKASDDFDCILGLSGGIDSSYLLHLVVTKFNLRPLVFHVDAGWNSQIATNNIERLVEKLNLDLFTEVINWTEMRDIQLSFFKSGVPHIDTPQDHAFFSTMYKFASKYNVKSIITGGNYSTECIRNPKEWMYFQSDSTQLRDIQNYYGNVKIKEFPLTNILWHKIWLPYFRNIKVFRLLDFLPYNKDQAVKELIELYDFQPYSQKHFESRFTKFYESYWLYERFGYDTRKVQLSSLILTNQMKRDEALEILKYPPYNKDNIHHEFDYVSKKLGITNQELEYFFTQSKKTYKDFKNQEIIYELGSFISRFFGLEKGGKR